MTRIKYAQFGIFSVAVMLPLFIFSLIMLINSGFNDTIEVLIMGFVALTMLICLLIFYKLTIYIDDTYVTFILGLGLIRKKYLISDIKSCNAVRNSPLTGIGIRKIPNGWLYNVSGFKAVELEFRNKKSIVRIGTDNPEEVAQTINDLIKKDVHGSDSWERDANGHYSFVIILLLLLLPAILIFTGNRETTVETSGKDLTINGMYGLNVNYRDIIQLDTISTLPVIKSRINGYAFGKTLKGNFLLDDRTSVKMFAVKGYPPYIKLRSNDMTIYINFKTPGKTQSLYDNIIRGIAASK